MTDRSQRALQVLAEHDADFSALVESLYGPAVDPLDVWGDVFGDQPFAKRESLGHKVANTVGLGATAIGTGYGVRELATELPHALKAGGKPGQLKAAEKIEGFNAKAGKLVPKLSPKAKVATAGALLAGDATATAVLGHNGKKKDVAKGMPGVKAQAQGVLASTHSLLDGILKPTGKHAKTAQHAAAPQPLAYKAGQGLGHAVNNPGKTAAGAATGGLLYTGGRSRGRKQGYNQAIDDSYAKRDDPLLDKPVRPLTQTEKDFGLTPDVILTNRQNRKRRSTGMGLAAAAPSAAAGLVVGGRRAAVGAGLVGGAAGALHGHESYKMQKNAPDVEWGGTFSKFDDDKRQAFGFASVVKKNGMPVIDRQGDFVTPEDMETAAYVYVQKSRVGGDMHKRTDDDRAHHVSDLIESVVFTPEKCRSMGMPEEVGKALEGHWWVGYQIHDEDVWQEVKKKGRTGFSIHGRGKRSATSVDEVMA